MSIETRFSSDLSNQEKRNAMRLVSIAWGFGVVWMGVITGAPFTGFARYLGADDFMLGILGSLGGIGALFQLFAAYLIERFHARKTIFLFGLLSQRLIWFVIAALALLPESTPYRLTAFTILFIIALSVGSIGAPAWQSWMNDLIHKRIRGRYFAQRAALATVTNMIGLFVLNRLLDMYPEKWGLFVVFSISAALGTLDILLFIWVPGLKMQYPEIGVSFWETLTTPLKDTRFRPYLRYAAEWSIGIGVAAPFFNPYFLEYIQLSYTEITIYIIGFHSIAQVISFRPWGRTIDRCGTLSVVRACSFGVMIIPFVWIFCRPGYIWIAPLNAILIGLSWSGLGVSAFNLMLEACPDKKKSAYMALLAIVSGIGLTIGPLLGGWYMSLTKDISWQIGDFKLINFHLLFVITGLLRYFSSRHLLKLEGLKYIGVFPTWRIFFIDLFVHLLEWVEWLSYTVWRQLRSSWLRYRARRRNK